MTMAVSTARANDTTLFLGNTKNAEVLLVSDWEVFSTIGSAASAFRVCFKLMGARSPYFFV
jgi:hypothetical protein